MPRKPPDKSLGKVKRRGIVLIGFMGTGKSAIGRALSRRLGVRHVDTDQAIEEMCGKKIPQIFLEDGEPAFRAAELRIVRRLCYSAQRPSANTESRVMVISTGGGTPLRAENARMLRRIGDMVWLTASMESIVERVTRHIERRPLLAGYEADPVSRLESLIVERAPRYRELADHTVDTSTFASPDDAAIYIISLLKLNEEI